MGARRGPGLPRGQGPDAPGAGRALALAALAALCGPGLAGCRLTRPPDAETLLAAGAGAWRTPEAAFETFRVAFASDLPTLEYRSLSHGFRRREGISLATYLVARDELLEDHPLLALLARAKVVESQSLAPERHRLVVQAAGRRFAVDLVREDRFQIYRGGDFLADGALDFDSAVRVDEHGGGRTVRAEIVLDEDALGGAELEGLTEVGLARVWRIDRLGDLAAP